MSEQEEPWEVLGDLAYAICPSCDAENERGAQVCASCGASLDNEEDGAPLDVLSLDGKRLVHHVQTPFNERGNVKKLMTAVEGVRKGTIAHSEYKKLVGEVHQVGKVGVALGQAPVIKKRIAEQNEDVQDVALRLADALKVMHDGTTRMMQYLDTLDPQDAEEGWAIAEKAMREMELIQNEAYSIPA